MFNLVKPFYPLLLTAVQNNPESAHLQLLKTLNIVARTRNTLGGRWLISQLDKSFCVYDPRLKQT
ncbi:MAG: quinone-dependent dihydroorotate dehydrogenase, partial [cyanobacterium endosymbiont of Rhopalodia yunnanensis]